MSLCGFGQFGDLRCASLCCYGRLIIDRNCNLSVPNAMIDHILSVDIGGTVDMAMTTINFTNSTIDFSGSSITGLDGNINGNLTANSVVVNKMFASEAYITKIYGNLCGNIYGNSFGVFEGQIIGNGCLNTLTVDTISPKTTNGNIIINGNIEKVCTPLLLVDVMTAKNSDTIKVIGNIVADRIDGNIYGVLFGNICGFVLTNEIGEKTPGAGVTFLANVIVPELKVLGNLFINNLSSNNGCFPNVITDMLSAKTGSEIKVTDSLNAENSDIFCLQLYTDTIIPPSGVTSVYSVLYASDSIIAQNQVTAQASMVTPMISVDLIKPNFPNQSLNLMCGNNINLMCGGNVVTTSVCADKLYINEIISKTPNDSIQIGNIVTSNVVADNITVYNNFYYPLSMTIHANLVGNVTANVIKTTHIIGNSGVISIDSPTTFTNGNVIICKNALKVGNIFPCTTGGNVIVNGSLKVNGIISGTLGNVLVTSMCGNATLDSIFAKKQNGNIDIYGNVLLHSAVHASIVSPSIKGTTLTSGRVPIIGLNGLIGDDSDLTFSGSTLTATNISSSGSTCSGLTSTNTLQITSIPILGGVPYLTGTGVMQGLASFNFDGTTLTSPFLKSSSLTVSGGIPYLNGAGLLQNISTFTFNGTTLTTPNLVVSTLPVSGGVTFLNGSGQMNSVAAFTYNVGTGRLTVPSVEINPNTLTITSLGTNRILYVVGGVFTTDPMLMYSGGTLSTTNLTVTALSTADAIPFVNISGQFNASSSLTYNSGSSTLTAPTIVASTGDITATSGNMIVNGSAKQLRVKGGAITDFIGQGTLVAGVATIANTNIAATDRIFCQRYSINASTALGDYIVTISPGASFTVTSVQSATPASTQTGDTSQFNYFIVRQV